MDIFNIKRVSELEHEVDRLRHVEREKDELKSMLAKAESELRLVLTLKDAVPEDCTPGHYCEACEFAKDYWYYNYGYYHKSNTAIRGIICGKGSSCKNFIQKELKETC